MSVSLSEVLAHGGFEVESNEADARWLISQVEHFDELVTKAEDLIEKLEDERSAKNIAELQDVSVHLANFKKELNALIRTEKLKLLDEVIHQSTVNLKSARAVAGWAEIRKKQLEAEL